MEVGDLSGHRCWRRCWFWSRWWAARCCCPASSCVLSRAQLRSSLRQAAKSQSGVPIRLPKATDRCTVLLCVADETPGFVLAYLNASQNCVHLLGVPAVLTVPFADEQAALAQCYAAAGPARCREALLSALSLPEDTHYLALAPSVLQAIADRYGMLRVGFSGALTAEELALTGVMAALSLVAYLFFRVPFYGGSSFHLGNTFTALTALLLDGVSGGLAGAIGLALADILAGDPGYAVTTFVLKFIIGITCGAVAHKVFKLRDQDRHSAGYLVKVIVSAGSGLLLNVFTDPFLGYFRNVYIFGQEYTVAQALSKIAGGVTFVNSVVSTICVVILYLALRPALERAGLLPKGKN